MSERAFLIKFAEHVASNDLASEVTGFAACGLIEEMAEREYVVRAYRPGSLAWLKKLLDGGSARGVVLKWTEIA